jgi:DNA ligase (NAD+)
MRTCYIKDWILKEGVKVTEELRKLKELIDYHDDLYYKKAAPEISDAEYDALKQQYIAMGGEYDYVPDDTDGGATFTHIAQVLSLDKVNDETELREKVKELWPVVVEPKIDGMTIVAYNDKFVTRGNGFIGEIVTPGVSQIQGIQFSQYNTAVRMEVFITRENLEKLNTERQANGEKTFENTRNAIPGILRKADPNYIKYLNYHVYNILGSSATEEQQLITLKNQGWSVVPYGVFSDENGKTVDDAVRFIISYKDKRDRLPYDIDGLVIKSNIPNAQAVFGVTGHHPKNAFAWKFPSEGKWTIINDVTWQVGRTGKLTPVAEIQPVRVCGSEISRVTLHNKGIMNALGVKAKGQKVFVIKANDVIPAITKAETIVSPVDSFPEPKKCPDCGGDIDVVNDQAFCNNPICKSKLIGSIVHLAKKDALDIEGLSDETAKKLIDSGFVKYPWDIFTLDVTAIQQLPGFAKRSATTLYNRIQRARTTELHRFLYATGVPGVGRSVSRDIAETVGSFAEFINDIKAGCVQIKQINGIGNTIVQNIMKYAALWLYLFQYVTPKDSPVKRSSNTTLPQDGTSGWTKSYTFVITGTLSKPRAWFENYIRNKGHNVSNSVSRNTDYLVVGQNVGATKTNAAKAKGIKVISESELMNILNN